MNKGLFLEGTPIQKVHWSLLGSKSNEIYIKRDDLIHPFVSGNKWRKLKYNILEAQNKGFKGILTYGGAYSNHLLATACACASFGLKSIGYVRGEELNFRSNHVLKLCYEYGMELRFIPRDLYKSLSLNSKDIEKDYFTVAEGGHNENGVKGCEEILGGSFKELPIDTVFCAVGTSTTFCGIIRSVPLETRVYGIAAIGDSKYLEDTISQYTGHIKNWSLEGNYARRGFGKYDKHQLDVMRSFTSETGILLDPIYTGKVLCAIQGMFKNQSLEQECVPLMIHTGGMTGILSEKWLKS